MCYFFQFDSSHFFCQHQRQSSEHFFHISPDVALFTNITRRLEMRRYVLICFVTCYFPPQFIVRFFIQFTASVTAQELYISPTLLFHHEDDSNVMIHFLTHFQNTNLKRRVVNCDVQVFQKNNKREIKGIS